MTDVTRAGIAIEANKLPVFKRHLEQNGYTFENAGPLPGELLLLKVNTTNLEALRQVVAAALAETAGVGTKQ